MDALALLAATQVSGHIVMLVEGLLIVHALLAAVFLLIILYFVFLGDAVRFRLHDRQRRKRLVVLGLPLLAFALQIPAHVLAIKGYLPMAILALAAGTAGFAVYYFRAFRPLLASGSHRVQNTAIIWALESALILGAMVLLTLFRDLVQLDGKLAISYDLVIKVASVVISALGIAFTYIMRTDQEQKTAQLSLYQTLEIQSLTLFRFECENKELVKGLWYSDEAPADDVLRYRVRQYACQMLNLFEMAIRFRLQGILPPDVFGSWVAWIWDICECRTFQTLWTDDSEMRLNYMPDLREALDSGITIARQTEGTSATRRREFFTHMADVLNCRAINTWMDVAAGRKPQDPA